MRVFVIGNGFDKGHGLKTNYWDFRIFLKNCYPDFLYSFESKYNIYSGFLDDEKYEMLWKEFEKNLANIDEGVIIEDAVSIEMGLESGDVGIEDTLFSYFSDELKYINKLSYYLRLWIQSIRVRDVQPRTSIINSKSDDIYVTFNYTGVLENVYKINNNRVIHIHGSLRKYDNQLVIGHGNYKRLEDIRKRILEAEEIFDEKETSICKAIENYYKSTYKDIDRYKHKLLPLNNMNIEEVIIIGHSIGEVDMPYFRMINSLSNNNTKWTIYYYNVNERQTLYNNLKKCGIKESKIKLIDSTKFYNIK